MKERTSQLERDFGQLKFENETLRYRLHDQTSSISLSPDHTIESFTAISSPPPRPPPPLPAPPVTEQRILHRSSSFSASPNPIAENARLTCSLSSFSGLL